MERSLRAADAHRHNEQGDFVVRQRRPIVLMLLLPFILSFIALYATYHFTDASGHWFFLFVLVVVIGALSWITMLYTLRERDMLLLSEFQNTLFSAAARLQARFCLIVRQDGEIVYQDPGFQRHFPDQARDQTLLFDRWLQRLNTETAAMQTLQGALSDGKPVQVVATMHSAGDAEPTKMVLSMDPLPRPRGYFLLRAREYVVRTGRGGGENPQLLQFLNQHLTEGFYTLTEHGRFSSVNDGFAAMLGYTPQDLQSMPLNNILADRVEGESELADYAGPARLLTRAGDIIQVEMSQQLMRDPQGGLQGAYGIVRTGDDKKKL